MISKLHNKINKTGHCWGEEAYIENGAQTNEQIIETEVQKKKELIRLARLEKMNIQFGGEGKIIDNWKS